MAFVLSQHLPLALLAALLPSSQEHAVFREFVRFLSQGSGMGLTPLGGSGVVCELVSRYRILLN